MFISTPIMGEDEAAEDEGVIVREAKKREMER